MTKREVETVDEHGALVVPIEWRESLGLLPGEQAVLLTDGEDLRIVSVRRERAALANGLRGSVDDGGTVDEFIAARRAEAHRESDDA